jgi:predicted enzyme related to lactoylglutathione lyase
LQNRWALTFAAASVDPIRPDLSFGLVQKLGQVTPDRHVEPKGVMLTLLTKNVDDWHRRLVALGAPVVGEPRYTESSKSYSFVCLDPEGYRIEFQEFRDALWQWPEP